MKISDLTGQQYDPGQCVYILNMVQVARYIKHGARPVDICVTNDKLCFAFYKNETQQLYKEWCAHTLT